MITSITHHFKRQVPIRWLNNRCRNQGFLECFKGFYTIIIKNKGNILLQKICKRPRNFREVLNKSPIETSMTEKTTNTFNVTRTWHLLNCVYLSFVHFNTTFKNFMTQDNAFIDHKVALLPIQDKVSLLTSLQNSIKVAQAIIKRSSINRKIIHENFNNLFIEIREYSSHASLESSRC